MRTGHASASAGFVKNALGEGLLFLYLATMNFDVSIDLVTAHLEPGSNDPATAVAAVRAAVEMLPGAGWVSVVWCGTVPAIRWLRVFRPGSSLEVEGAEWDAVRCRVEGTVAKALA